ncbi:MAG: folylpolyglutamate synthase/dihydrofolate synthase family protein [Prochloraceae cyanobacterium]|nr:folylpolyglutamate synthase/dihydrofolate synthase family protein [Prochloraceae cyanobacterium]
MIENLLKPLQRFGVHLGLERIETLLNALDNPQQQVPIIHVAGTNGKGSVCAYLSSILSAAGYKVGRYTSPHLVNWTERICINQEPIASEELEAILKQIQAAIDPNIESPTQFEVITAAAWLYFAKNKVDIAIIEVGLGGRLDATNVCSDPLVTIITSISREHWQRLGDTIAKIAYEKAGILKSNCPVVVGNLPSEANQVVVDRATSLNCPLVEIAGKSSYSDLKSLQRAKYEEIEYPLPLLGEVQLNNSACAIAAIQILQQKGWKISQNAIETGMSQTKWLGRVQWTTWQDRPILIDGAHNTAAASCLRNYVDTLDRPVNWVMGMLTTKDHSEILQTLLRNGDRLFLVPVPEHSSAAPEELAALATNICPQLTEIKTFPDLFTALEAAKDKETLTVLCGSLYLVGYFFAKQ